jgi:hypothetical protein
LGKDGARCAGLLARIGAGVADFNLSSEVNTLCQRTLSFFVSMGAEVGIELQDIVAQADRSLINFRWDSLASNFAYVLSASEYSAALSRCHCQDRS